MWLLHFVLNETIPLSISNGSIDLCDQNMVAEHADCVAVAIG